jgi:hypothetical protein
MEEVIKIEWEGKDENIVVREISWKEKTDAIRKSIKEVIKGRVLKKEVDPILQKELMMLTAVKSAPFEINLENLGKMRSRDGEKVYAAYSKLNDPEDSEEGED